MLLETVLPVDGGRWSVLGSVVHHAHHQPHHEHAADGGHEGGQDTAGEPLVCAVNFAGMPHNGFHLPLPRGGQWEEVLNTDETRFGGSGVVNGPIAAIAEPQYAQPAHAVLDLPPLGAVWLRPSV